MTWLEVTRQGPAAGAALLAASLLLRAAALALGRLPRSRSGESVKRAGAVLRRLAPGLLAAACVGLFGAVVARAVVVERIPLAGQYELALSVAAMLAAASLAALLTGAARPLSTASALLALTALLYARQVPQTPLPTPPVQQNPLLLALHGGTGAAALCASSIAAVAAVLLLRRGAATATSQRATGLERVADRAALAAFLLLSLVLLLGSWWALETWGYYWDWDAKECAALAAWLVYAAYLHVRPRQPHVDRRAAVAIVLAWLVLLLTYAGNLFFTGLHSYA